MFSSLDLHYYLDALVFELRRPPGWCESFDGCMSKLPEASVGAATGSCGLPDDGIHHPVRFMWQPGTGWLLSGKPRNGEAGGGV